MPELTPPSPPRVAPPPRQADAGHIPITEELDSAKWTLPPVGVILIGIAIIGVIAAGVLFFNRPRPVGKASIQEAYAVDTTNGVLAAVQFTIANGGERAVFVKNVAATLASGGQQYTDDTAASASDYERYEQAYPDLRQHVTKAITPETKINPGQEISGTAIFSFNVNKPVFESRSGLKISVSYFDNSQPVIVEENRSTPQK